MATITSNGSGPWSTGGTWVGGVSPGSGDLAVLANGHTVTITGSDNITIGDGDASHYAIRTAGTGGTGILVCQDGFQLTLTASVLQGFANWTVGRGVITYTNAADGIWQIGDSHNNSVRLDILGQSGTYGTLQSSSTGELAFDGAGLLSAGLGSIRYYNLTKIGNASTKAWRFNLTQSGDSFSAKDCTFTNCGELGTLFNAHGACSITIEDTIWSSTPGACLGASIGSEAMTGGTRSIQGNYFDAPMGSQGSGGNWAGFTIRFNFIAVMWQTDSADDVKPAVFGSNLFVNPGAPSPVIRCDTSASDPNFLHLHSQSGPLSNVHALALSVQRSVVFDGWFIEPGDTDDSGDYILANEPSSARSHTVSHCVARLNEDGTQGGQIISAGGNANIAFSAINNTYFSTEDAVESGSCSYGETYEGHANIFAAIYNNLVVSNTGDGYIFTRRGQRTFQDGAAAANIHHNGKYQLSAGNVGVNGYGDKATNGTFVAMFSTTTGLGSGDVTANPSFVDDTRSIGTWAVARGYTASGVYNTQVAAAYAAIAVDRRTRIPDLITWCKEGFAPTNTAFQGAGSGSVDIGAIAVVASTPIIPILNNSYRQRRTA